MVQRMGERQRWAWLAGGLSVIVGACLCGLGWIWVLAGGLLAGLYYIYMDTALPATGLAAMLSKGVAVLTLLWLVLLMAWSAHLADSAFPMIDGFPVLGWTVLALAAWGSRKGAAACARCAGVLCLFLTILYSTVAVFALPDIQLKNLKPYGPLQNGIWTAGLFLLPGVVWYLPCSQSRKKPAWLVGIALPLAAGLLAAVTAGVLSPLLAASQSAPLYTLTQSVSLFGVVERIEPLLSAALTMGVFCLLSAMACAGKILLDQLYVQKWNGVAVCAAAGVLMGIAGKFDIVVIAIGSLVVLWLVPMAVLVMRKKSSKKRKKPVDNGD